MPELPEVETIRRGLQKQIIRKKIKKIIIKKPKLIKNSKKIFCSKLIGNSFLSIGRVGKVLIFKIREDLYLLIHLKMTGQLIYCDKKMFVVGGHINSKREEFDFKKNKKAKFCRPGRYTHIIFQFEDASRMYYNDLRQFGYLKIVNKKKLEEMKKKYGIEPGRSDFNFNNFKKTLSGKKRKIKALLLDQSIISGLGNIYVDESLFSAKIFPERKANSLTDKEVRNLYNSIKRIIKLALKYKGTTFSDFVGSNGKKGGFKKKLNVYGREGLKCKRKKCSGIIKKIKVVGRGTVFCPVCQKQNINS